MGFAAHLGPWRLGTVKDTTGTTAGTIANMGCTEVAQTTPLTFTNINSSLTGNAFVLPAGALITSIQVITNEAFSAATTVKFTIGSTDLCTAATVTNANVYAITPVASAAVASLYANVGSTDAIVTYTATKGSTLTTGGFTFVIRYVVRASNGASAPTAFQN